MTLRAIQDKVIIKPDLGERRSEFGLILVGKDRDNQSEQGVVVAKGPGYKDEHGQVWSTDDVPVGATALFQKNMGTEVNHEGETYYIMPVMNVLAVILD